MQQYLDLLADVLTNGSYRLDRTGVGAYSVFGRQVRFDLTTGFPLLTTKKLHLKSIVHELLWFLSGDTNIKYLEDNGVKIWSNWRRPWTKDRPIVKVRKIHKPYVPYSGDFSYRGLGTIAEDDRKLVGAWRSMMGRCYDPQRRNYKFYGGRGVSVAKEWHDAATFISDVKTIPHWYYKSKNWNIFQLDKDHYGAKQYSKDTCIWLPKEENIETDAVCVTSPSGDEYWFMGIYAASEALNVSKSSIHRFIADGMPHILKANNKKLVGWKFSIGAADDHVFRRALIQDGDLGPIYGASWRAWPTKNGVVDQVSDLISGIQENPYGRRHIISAWNPSTLPDAALPCCHCFQQFFVDDGRLSCQLYQRSCDVFLGCPFNIASYALLTMIVAQVVGLEPGEFIYTLGDVHLYSNHIEQAREQLTRTPRPLPTMTINPGVRDIFDFKYEDFKLTNYNPYPHIKAEVAV